MAHWNREIILFAILFLCEIQGVQCIMDTFYIFLGVLGGLGFLIFLTIVIICVVVGCTAKKRQVNVTSRQRAPVTGTGYHGQTWAAPSNVGTPGSYGYYHGTENTGQPPHSQIPLQNVTQQAQGQSQQSQGHPPPSYDMPSNQEDAASPPPPYEQPATKPPSGDVSMGYNEQAALAAPNVVEPVPVNDEKETIKQDEDK